MFDFAEPMDQDTNAFTVKKFRTQPRQPITTGESKARARFLAVDDILDDLLQNDKRLRG